MAIAGISSEGITLRLLFLPDASMEAFYFLTHSERSPKPSFALQAEALLPHQ